MKNEAAIFWLAVQFLTRLPTPASDLYTPERLAASVRYYPLVGAVVGGLCAGVYWACALVLPGPLPALIAVAAGLLATGGFHEDGLADTLDGVGGGATRADVLRIMRDSRIGAYGALALIIVIPMKIAALSALPVALACGALIAGHALSRLSAVLVVASSRYVRDEGVGKPVADGVSKRGLAVVVATGAVVAAAWLAVWPPVSLAAGALGLAVGHAAMRALFERKIGGYTGDALGAVQQTSETLFYVGLAAWI
ncbi:MAG: adenosylcobinamide-GDP ribazoletransferase [Pseudomonadota bacterium]